VIDCDLRVTTDGFKNRYTVPIDSRQRLPFVLKPFVDGPVFFEAAFLNSEKRFNVFPCSFYQGFVKAVFTAPKLSLAPRGFVARSGDNCINYIPCFQITEPEIIV
jgi:hypothetical protein